MGVAGRPIAAFYRMPWYQCAPEGGACVILAEEAANALRARTIEAFLSLPKRGTEIGGLLLGRVERENPLLVHIDGFEEIPCEHRYGPSYVLSDSDRATLRSALGRPEIVGFFRTYTGRQPAIDNADEELLRTHFADPRCVFLLLQPLSWFDCQGTFLFGAAGAVPPLVSFPSGLTKTQKEIPPVTTEVPPQSPAPAAEVRPAITLPPAHRAYRPVTQELPVRKRGRFWLPWAACIVLSIVAALAYEWWTLARPQTPEVTQTVTPVPPAPVIPARRPESSADRTTPPPIAPQRRRISAIAVPPAVIHEVQPGISSGIRARISDRIVVPVRVQVSSSGKVTGSAPEGDGDGLYRYLAEQAAKAARLWTFSPAKNQEGARVAADKTIYFVFTR